MQDPGLNFVKKTTQFNSRNEQDQGLGVVSATKRETGMGTTELYKRFMTTNQMNQAMTFSNKNSTDDLHAITKLRDNSPEKQQIVQKPYGQIVGRGNIRTKTDKLREITRAQRNSPSPDNESQLTRIISKRHLADGQVVSIDAFNSRRQSADSVNQETDGISPERQKKVLDDEPEYDYIKVPCRFTGW